MNKFERVVIYTLLVWGIAIMYVETNKSKAHNNRIIKLEAAVKVLETQDSLIHEHYSRCSFIDKDSIEVGFDGYLRKK
jgi:hypothetical protein